MFFKNANVYQLHEAADLAAESLNDMLKGDAAQPLGNADATRYGWTPPAGRNCELYLHEIQGHRLVSMLKQERILPSSVVADAVAEQVDEIETNEGRKLTKKEKSAIKEQVTEELLPRAFVRTTKIDAWLDEKRQRITINSPSRARCEELLDLLRQTLGTLKVTPLSTQTLPIRAMTSWLSDASTRPANLQLGDVITLKAKGDDGVWKGRQIDPDSDEIQQMLETGRQAVELAMTVNDNVSFILNDGLTLKSLRFGDKLIEEADHQDDGDDATARLEGDFYLMANALAEAIDSLIAMMGGQQERAVPVPLEEALKDDPNQETDPLTPHAIAMAEDCNQKRENLTVSKLQRAFKIGYNRAARLQEHLIKQGEIPNPYGQRGV